MSPGRYEVVSDRNKRPILDDKELRTLEQVKQFVDISQETESLTTESNGYIICVKINKRKEKG